MKKHILLPLLFLVLACSTDEQENSDSENSFLEKYDGTLWDAKFPAESDIIDYLATDDQFIHNYLSIYNSISFRDFTKVFAILNNDIYHEIFETPFEDGDWAEIDEYNICWSGADVYMMSDFEGFRFNMIDESEDVLEWSYTSADYDVLFSFEVNGNVLTFSWNGTGDGRYIDNYGAEGIITFEKVIDNDKLLAQDDGSLLEELQSCREEDYEHPMIRN